MDQFILIPGCLGFFPRRLSKIWLLAGFFVGLSALSSQAQVATPTLSPAGGTFSTMIAVTVSCATAGAELHYTTDGSAPNLDSPLVPASRVLVIGRTQTLKVGGWSGSTASAIASGFYVVTGGISCGQQFGLAVRFDGRRVWAWGDNSYGQLGNGTTQSTTLPAQVSNSAIAGDYLQNVAMVAGGRYHALALKKDGTVWAWGNNNAGQLGNGTTANQLYPSAVQIAGGTNLTGIVQIATVWDTSFALRSDGTVWAWGANASGQTGVTASGTPVTLARQIKATSSTNFTGVTSIVAGNAFAMALKSDGTVWVWGGNGSGQFGSSSNPTANSIYPVKVASLSNIVSLGACNATCYAVGSDGLAWAWGANGKGQLANGGTVDQATPATMKTASSTNLTGVIGVAAGFSHAALLKSDGSVWSVGYNGDGQLGYNGSHTSSNYLIKSKRLKVDGSIDFLSNMVAVAAGANYTMGVQNDGVVYTGGSNALGQAGNGTGPTNDVVYATRITTAAFPELINHAPTITLGISAAPYYQTGTITLTANPQDTDAVSGFTNGLSSVNFFDGPTFMGTSTGYPWSFDLSGPSLGNHSFSAQVVDEVGATSTSSSVPVSITYDPTLDTDGDGIPDVWEMAHNLNMNDPSDANADPDGDGLTNLQEYFANSDPTNTDTNGNGIPDAMDTMQADGIPAAYLPLDGTPFAPTLIVDAAGGGNYIDLQSAIDAITADYQSIQVNDGSYAGQIAVYGHKIFIYSVNGAGKTSLTLRGAVAGFYVSSNCLIRGFTIRDGSGDIGTGNINGGNVFVDQASPIFERCVISQGQGDEGAAIASNYGNPLFVNCTIAGNQSAGSAVYAWGNPVKLNDCVLWNSSCANEKAGAGITAQECIVRGGAPGGNLNVDPLLGIGGHLLVGSPAINAGGSHSFTINDMDGELIHNQPAIGADEYWDTDGDGIPDWWEQLNVDSGLDITNPTDAATDPDGSGSTFLQNYQAFSANQN